jgi:transcriptional regulator of acetoin/glycerol metabolism
MEEYGGERYRARSVDVPSSVRARLVEHTWPGNVRELKNAVENMIALSPGGRLGAVGFDDEGDPRGPRATLRQKTVVFERGVIVAALAECGGNRTEAARCLGISRATLHEKLRRYEIRR